jgi:hypothetical protein
LAIRFGHLIRGKSGRLPTFCNIGTMGKLTAAITSRARTRDWALQPHIFPAKSILAVSEKTAARRRNDMAWTTPVLVEICAGLEINGYLPPEI